MQRYRIKVTEYTQSVEKGEGGGEEEGEKDRKKIECYQTNI